MAKHVEIQEIRTLSAENDKFRLFEREVIGGIEREIDTRKQKAESARITREKKAKRKRQRAAAGMS